MPALGVRRELDLVDGNEVSIEILGHGLDRAYIEARGGRLDLLLAGDQGDLVRPNPGNHLVVDLPRQQPQRQADDANLVGEHALNGEVGFARIGGPQHGGDAAPSQGICGLRG